jgi:hypothetical protein
MNLPTLQSLAARTRNEINRLHQKVFVLQQLEASFLTRSKYFLDTITKENKNIQKLVVIQKEIKKEICRTIEDERNHLDWEAENKFIQENRREYFKEYGYRGFNAGLDTSEEF